MFYPAKVAFFTQKATRKMLQILNNMFHNRQKTQKEIVFLQKKWYFCRWYEKDNHCVPCASRRNGSGGQSAAAAVVPERYGAATWQTHSRLGTG